MSGILSTLFLPAVLVGAGVAMLIASTRLGSEGQRPVPKGGDAGDMLRGAGIPTPEFLLCNMLALRVAQIPASPEFQHGELNLKVPVGEKRVIHLQYRAEFKSLYFMGVGSLDPTEGDMATLKAELAALRERSQLKWKIQMREASQKSALDLLESMLIPDAPKPSAEA